jgi:hypothetical protein
MVLGVVLGEKPVHGGHGVCGPPANLPGTSKVAQQRQTDRRLIDGPVQRGAEVVVHGFDLVDHRIEMEQPAAPVQPPPGVGVAQSVELAGRL